MPRTVRQEVTVDGKTLSLSNLDKVMYPVTGFTKGQMIDYYLRIAPVALPHLAGRALTMRRFPNGVAGQSFFEKNVPSHAPEWVRTGRMDNISYVVCDDLPTIVWLAQLADLELHPSLALVDDVDRPTILAFDLDPGEPATIIECCQVGLMVQSMFERLGLECFAKTSGSKGMQVYVPLHGSGELTYAQTAAFAHTVAQLLERDHRDLVVSEMAKAKRGGKIFIDWSQNARHKTTVGVYSLRAKDRPTASTPLSWDEVSDGASETDPDVLAFTSDRVLERVAEHGDLFAPVATLEQELPKLG